MTVPSLRTPVALVIFNRPDCTARVLEAIAAARPPRLYVIADGPRPDHPDDERVVAETRAVIDRVDWRCDVRTCYSDVNLNCDRRIASGLDWLFGNEREAILLEDDCLPDPSFFPYCEQLLERYRDDERVHMISGSTPATPPNEYSYRFSRCYPVWGWATWARAWKHFDPKMRAWPELRDTPWLEQHVPDRRTTMLAQSLFDLAYTGPIQQWDFQWMFSGWLQNAVAVTPSVNLVTNIGFGVRATHHRDADHPHSEMPAESIAFPLRHPPRVEVDERADHAMWEVMVTRFMRANPGRFRRVVRRVVPMRVRLLRGALRTRRAALRGRPADAR